jgi:hypothetical protein
MVTELTYLAEVLIHLYLNTETVIHHSQHSKLSGK